MCQLQVVKAIKFTHEESLIVPQSHDMMSHHLHRMSSSAVTDSDLPDSRASWDTSQETWTVDVGHSADYLWPHLLALVLSAECVSQLRGGGHLVRLQRLWAVSLVIELGGKQLLTQPPGDDRGGVTQPGHTHYHRLC